MRRAGDGDVAVMAAMAAELVRLHHGFDAERFFLPEEVESGYGWWFARELQNKDAVLLVAQSEEKVVGYAYGRVEERDWNQLLGRHAALHDVLVKPEARGSGAGRELVTMFCEIVKGLGVPRVVLHTAAKNTSAQEFFSSHGFRSTMIEMTLELGSETGA